jgi:hypothetical protein
MGWGQGSWAGPLVTFWHADNHGAAMSALAACAAAFAGLVVNTDKVTQSGT